MRENKLSAKLAAGAPTLGTRIHSVWPGVVEALGHADAFDYVEFLAEYAPYDLHDLEALARTAELYDLGSLIKVDQEPRTFVAQRAIGAGFQGVLFADGRDAEDVRECVAIARPATPQHGGKYGVAMRRMAYMGYGGTEDYMRALETTVVAIMIEKRTAVDDLANILAVPGVGLVQFGPFDYAMSAGSPHAARSEEVRSVERYVIEQCTLAGIPVRAEIGSAAEAEYYKELGVRHFSIGVDLVILFDWWRANASAVRDIVSAA